MFNLAQSDSFASGYQKLGNVEHLKPPGNAEGIDRRHVHHLVLWTGNGEDLDACDRQGLNRDP